MLPSHTLCTDGFHRSGDTPPAEAHAEAVVPVCGASVEAAESQSATDSSEDGGPALVLTQPVLFEDPLILHSPRVTIPKNNTKALKYGWPQPSKVSSVSENSFETNRIFDGSKCYTFSPVILCLSSLSWQEKVINLKDWCLKHNKKGLYVEGIHRWVVLQVVRLFFFEWRGKRGDLRLPGRRTSCGTATSLQRGFLPMW